jgi:hypothetical protein
MKETGDIGEDEQIAKMTDWFRDAYNLPKPAKKK